jgi:hypothetical protein
MAGKGWEGKGRERKCRGKRRWERREGDSV